MTLKTSIAALALTICASTVSAQVATTAESAVIGQSGQPNFPLEVVGANGVNYYCQSGTSVVNNVVQRLCRRSTSFGTTGGITGGAGLGGLSTTAAIGAAVGAAALIGLVVSNNSSTTGTN